MGSHRGRRRAARHVAVDHHGRRLWPPAPAGRQPAAAGTGVRAPRATCVPWSGSGRQGACSCTSWRSTSRVGADGQWWVVGHRTQAPSGLGLRAAEPIDRLATLSRRIPSDEGAAAGRQLSTTARHAAAPEPARRRRNGPPGAADAGSVHGNLFRACLPRALPRHPAGRGQRPDGARRARLPEDAARPAAGARHPAAAR